MSSTNSKKFLDLFDTIDEYKQVNKISKNFYLFNYLKNLFRQYVRKLLMLFVHQIDYQLKILIN
jgi:hypothetical protein